MAILCQGRVWRSAICLLCAFHFLAMLGQPGGLSLLSPVTSQAGQRGGSGHSTTPTLSFDGRVVAFMSAAPDLVTNDFNGELDVFVRARGNGPTHLVSANFVDGRSGNGASFGSIVSSNGQFVLFESSASDLVPNDTNLVQDIFVRDLAANTTLLVSRGTNGQPANRPSTLPSVTPDFRFVVFESEASNLVPDDTNNAADVFVWERATGGIRLVSVQPAGQGPGGGESTGGTISDDGRFVAFQSIATNLVSLADENNGPDVYVRDMVLRETRLVSVNTNRTASGNSAAIHPLLSGSGKRVVFQSSASDLIAGDKRIYPKAVQLDLGTGVGQRINTPELSGMSRELIDYEGSTALTFSYNAGTTNIYLRDAGTPAGEAGHAVLRTLLPIQSLALSRDGKQLLMVLLDVGPQKPRFRLYRHDVPNQTNSLLVTNGQGVPFNGNVLDVSVSGDGKTLAIQSDSSEIAPGTDGLFHNIYVREASESGWELISERHARLLMVWPKRSTSLAMRALSENGRFLLLSLAGADYSSPGANATELVLADLNNGTNLVLSLITNGAISTNALFRSAQLSGDGRYAAFLSRATDIHSASTQGYEAVFLRDIAARRTLLPYAERSGRMNTLIDASLSRDGTVLTYTAIVTNQHNIFQYDALTGLNSNLTQNAYSKVAFPLVSPDSRYLLFQDFSRFILKDFKAGLSWVVGSVYPSIEKGFGFTGDGRFAYFIAGGTSGYPALYRQTLSNNVNLMVATIAYDSSFSHDGRFAAVERMVTADLRTRQTFVYDLVAKTNLLVTAPMSATADSTQPLITPDGRWVVFRSHATNLVPQTTSGAGDLYLRDLRSQTIFLLSRNPANTQGGDALSANAQISFDGSTVAFESFAGNLVAGDYNQSKDVFVLRLGAGDSDNDGMDDAWELTYFGSLARNGTGDFDSDGVSDLDEFRAGTDPTDQGSAMRALALFSLSSGETKVMWSSVPGKTYRVQYTDSVLNPEWHVLVGDITATSSTSEKQDTTSAGIARRFYRVLLVN